MHTAQLAVGLAVVIVAVNVCVAVAAVVVTIASACKPKVYCEPQLPQAKWLGSRRAAAAERAVSLTLYV